MSNNKSNKNDIMAMKNILVGNGVKTKSICDEEASLKLPCKRNCYDICAIGSSLLFGFMCLTIGLLTTYFPLYDHCLNEHLSWNSIYPNFGWWKDPIPEVLLNVYVFNITNHEEFIAGRDKKLKLQEIGPITFREVTKHKDIEYHKENSTMSYTVTRQIYFKESANIKNILNKTIYVVNMPLSAASYVSDNIFMWPAFNLLLKIYKTEPIVASTIYNYFFNMTDPVLELANKYAPFVAPTKDTGILQNIYRNFTDRVNVNIGTKHGAKNFFAINTWNNKPTVPRFENECNASLKGSSEGALYPALSTKDTVLWYWRKTLCRPVPLHFDEEFICDGLKAYKYILRYDVYDRLENKVEDCYRGDNLPNGLSDLSKCFFDQPIVASFPHFCDRTGPWNQNIEGIKCNKSIHQSYTVIEPRFGVPLRQKAVSQSNVVLKDLSNFKYSFARFSKMVIPMFWLEYSQTDLTPIIVSTVNFFVNILPEIQFYISGGFIIIGLCLLMIGYLRLRRNEVTQKN
ncbi:hypothetical protein PVAND_007599 [Polypedilum vanderplanki]|uniref:Uncharacterized protein n=1 Tax=Polypedilum vanderplanki TaxID=319348 RepID=A0A9J6C763_POLVA|nr:hypothetical protein PVAND_007599 [Polypedilum vanderplanki]